MDVRGILALQGGVSKITTFQTLNPKPYFGLGLWGLGFRVFSFNSKLLGRLEGAGSVVQGLGFRGLGFGVKGLWDLGI